MSGVLLLGYSSQFHNELIKLARNSNCFSVETCVIIQLQFLFWRRFIAFAVQLLCWPIITLANIF